MILSEDPQRALNKKSFSFCFLFLSNPSVRMKSPSLLFGSWSRACEQIRMWEQHYTLLEYRTEFKHPETASVQLFPETAHSKGPVLPVLSWRYQLQYGIVFLKLQSVFMIVIVHQLTSSEVHSRVIYHDESASEFRESPRTHSNNHFIVASILYKTTSKEMIA